MLTLQSQSAAGADRVAFYIGGYTSETNKGIYRAELDLADGSMSGPTLAGEIKNPSFLAVAPSGKFVYSVMEIGDFEKQKSGGLAAFAMNADGTLKTLSQKPTGGQGACHVSVAPDGKTVFAANYGGGNVIAYAVADDGSLADPIGTSQHEGSGPNPKRQQKAYAHSFVPAPGSSYALSADLGCDRIFVYQYGDSLKQVAAVPTPAGSGPRHMAFHPTKPALYVVSELTNTVVTFAWDGQAASLKQVQEVSTLPEGFDKPTTSAEIAVHPSGKFVYSSNRGHDSIAVFRVNDDTTLTPVGHTPTGGQQPRNFAIDPTGTYLVAANQKSDNILSFKINPGTGELTPTGQSIKLDAPTCVRFMPVR
jgi:6-phosphogluconolactonase